MLSYEGFITASYWTSCAFLFAVNDGRKGWGTGGKEKEFIFM